MGFAKYVHDVYAHMGEDTGFDSNGNPIGDGTANSLWEARTCMTYHRPPAKAFADGKLPSSVDPNLTELLFDGDAAKIKDFFDDMKTGAYVRYGKYHPSIQPNGDPTPENGRHSIVFIAKDNNGIWVYECNQTYDGNDNHGCGVFIQYYTFSQLTNYKFVLNYVNHEYKVTASEPLAYFNAYYHKKGCVKCAGYVCQPHTSISATIMNTSGHRATFNCCGGNTATTWHTGTVSYSSYSTTQHTVRYSCCTGYVLANHTFVTGHYGGLMCADCGQGQNSIMAVDESTAVNI